ncbi:unnamed protein product, partial [marine sediment metagenome]
MIVIARREIDVRPIIGAVVVFAIIGAAIFGVYYFLIAKPAAEELEQAKLSALDQINNSLASIGTDQASTATSSYSAQVQAAGSKSEVESILANVTATIQLEQKRKELVGKNMERGLLPFSARYLGTLKFHFSTIGLVGMHEACRNFLGEGIETKVGKEFSIKVLKFMRKKLLEFQDETGNIYNLEATPAEGTSHRLARLDKKHYPKIITSGKKVPYYTNSTNLPVGYTNNLVEA